MLGEAIDFSKKIYTFEKTITLMNIEQEIFGFSAENEAVVLYTMTNSSGAKLKLMNIGAAIVSIEVPDREGNLRDVALGYRFHQDYMNDGAAVGKTVGRYANRIAGGRFTLNDVVYKLARNNAPNHLHGGPTGFANRIWVSRVEGDRVVFSYTSIAGEEGYPGELGVEVAYDWTEDNKVEIALFAGGTEDTIVNLTNHSYFNLNGDGNGDILDHELKLYASRWLPTNATQIPTGEFAPVEGTPMDFTTPTKIGAGIDADFEAIKIGSGYDHCWAVDGYEASKVSPVAELYSAESGISLEITSTQPGVQVYTANWLDDSAQDKQGRDYYPRAGVAIECQNFPDAPNQPSFPSAVLKAGETYTQYIAFKFSVK